MKTFYIIANSDKEESLRLAEQAKRYLIERGQVCVVRGQEQEHGNAHCELPSGNVDGILVLGGDGTLLRAARELAGRKIPFLGINLGHLGYLAEIEEQNLMSALDRLIDVFA